MTDLALLGLRRVPRQRRGQERVRRVLEVADRLLAEEGTAALTTTRVAAEAGTSVGSLYQYFPDRDAIVEALALGYMHELELLMAGLGESALPEDPAGAILDAFATAFRERAGFRALWFGGLRSEALRDATRPTRQVVARSLAALLSGLAPAADEQRVGAVARMAVLVGDGILREAFRLSPHGDERVLEEGARLLRGYLAEQLGIVTART